MKDYYFQITFSTGIIVGVWAGSEEAAKILAQADQIEAGNEWRHIESITKIEDKP